MEDVAPVLKDFGYLNGYVQTPIEVERCEHAKRGRKIGNCAYEYTCDICKITYKIDSSG